MEHQKLQIHLQCIMPSQLEVMLKDFISKQTAFNKSVEGKFDKIDTLASEVAILALDVDILKSKVMSHDTKQVKKIATSNAIQVRIDDNMKLLAELHARWEREDEMARKNNLAKVYTITTTSVVGMIYGYPTVVPRFRQARVAQGGGGGT